LSNRDRLAVPADMFLVDDCTAAAVDDVMRTYGSLPWTRGEFDELRAEVKRAAPGLAAGAMGRAVAVIAQATEARGRLARLHADALRPSVDDANAHLGRLVRPGFVLASGIGRLDDIERYVRAINHRLEQLAGGVERDRRRMAEVIPIERRYVRIVDALGPGQGSPELAEVAWQLEELRVATFAQPLVTKRPGTGSVSVKRIATTLDRLDRL
jgi:ATP-dependent helicase HrpA